MSRCRNCYTYGHNKRTCPDLTQRYRDRYDFAVRNKESQASIDQAAQRLIERTGIDPRTGNKVTRPSSAKRRCSYCKYKHGSYGDEGRGHTRRTCSGLKKDRKEAAKQNGIVRKKVVAALKREGIGVGATISYNSYGYYPDGNGDQVYEARNYPYMVVSINWDNITDQHRNPQPLMVRRLDQVCKVGARNTTSFPLPHLYEEDDKTGIKISGGRQVGSWDPHGDPDGYDARSLVTKAPANGWDKIPADYYQGSSKVTDSHFNNKKS